ncbi:MarR family transcriptional regulator [Curtobacterium sp. MCLR17_036]|uniref:MarR family winged helix-turn-helix transcriptional regulator n=1 Tax=Curtobacterium sp. MCLR17_036 TaxID=2175620 RepID=UPI0024DFED61|nr:MarR family transcriptional regulator [Curtobacterium sp. MCLR17_036]WIE65479.1 MarR family transcriptional regulator [Curtobacterium sp. MCLR17_036]
MTDTDWAVRPTPTTTLEPTPTPTPDQDLDRALEAYRSLQVHHARVAAAEAARRGLGTTDLRFLFALAAHPSGRVLPKQAAGALGLSTGAMTSLIDRLEARDLVRRVPNPADRRSVEVRITEAGTRSAAEVKDVYREAFSAAVPTDRMAVLAALLESLDQELVARLA